MYIVFVTAAVIILNTKMHPTNAWEGNANMFYVDISLLPSQW